MFAVKKLVKEPRPRVPFLKIKDKILGKPYDLSLVLCGDALTQKLNKRYRKKNKPTNVLSFPLSKNEGEIFLNLPLIKKESKKFKINIQPYGIFIYPRTSSFERLLTR